MARKKGKRASRKVKEFPAATVATSSPSRSLPSAAHPGFMALAANAAADDFDAAEDGALLGPSDGSLMFGADRAETVTLLGGAQRRRSAGDDALGLTVTTLPAHPDDGEYDPPRVSFDGLRDRISSASSGARTVGLTMNNTVRGPGRGPRRG